MHLQHRQSCSLLRAASNAHARTPAAAARHISNTKTPTHKHHRRAQSASQPRQAQLPPQRTTPNTAQPTCTWPHSLQPATLPCCCMNGWALLYDQVPQAQHSTAPHRIDNTSSHGHAELCTAAHHIPVMKSNTLRLNQSRHAQTACPVCISTPEPTHFSPPVCPVAALTAGSSSMTRSHRHRLVSWPTLPSR